MVGGKGQWLGVFVCDLAGLWNVEVVARALELWLFNRRPVALVDSFTVPR